MVMELTKRRGPLRQPGHALRRTWRRRARRARATSQQRNASPSRQHDSPCEWQVRATTPSHGPRESLATRREPQWRASCTPSGPSRCCLRRRRRHPSGSHLEHDDAERDECVGPATAAASSASSATPAAATARRHGAKRAERRAGRPARQALVPVFLPGGARRPPR